MRKSLQCVVIMVLSVSEILHLRLAGSGCKCGCLLPTLYDVQPVVKGARRLRLQCLGTSRIVRTAFREDRDPFFDGPQYLKTLVSNARASLVIGSDFIAKDDIEKRTGTRLKLTQPGSYYPFSMGDKVLLISGSDDKVLEVLRDTDLWQEEPRGGLVALRVLIPKALSGKVIGRGSQIVLEAQRHTLAKISVLEVRSLEPQLEEVVKIIGTPEQILAAVKWLLSVLHTEENILHVRKFLNVNYGFTGTVDVLKLPATVSFEVTERQAAFIVGKQGKTVKAIEQVSRTLISVARGEPPNNATQITIRGRTGDVHFAHIKLLTAMTRMTEAN